MPRDHRLLKGFLADITSVPPIIQVFKFNPGTITDSKITNWVGHNIPGLAYQRYHWTGGGPRVITFELFLDGYERANSIAGGTPGIDAGIHTDIANIQRMLYPKTGNLDIGGILTGQETSLSGLNPFDKNAEEQFIKPPKIVFGLGTLLLDVLVTKADIVIEMFSSKLDPVRAKVDIELRVLEHTALAKVQATLRTVRSTLGGANSIGQIAQIF